VAAAATAALLHRGRLGVDAARAAAPAVGGQRGPPAVRDLHGLEEKEASRVGAPGRTSKGPTGDAARRTARPFTFHDHLATAGLQTIKTPVSCPISVRCLD